MKKIFLCLIVFAMGMICGGYAVLIFLGEVNLMGLIHFREGQIVNMNVCISECIIEKNDEKLLLVVLLGIFKAMQSNSLSIREAERFLFSPYIFNRLKIKNCNPKIINIIERGCELENIKSLIPDHLSGTIEELIKLTMDVINEYPSFEEKRWVHI